MGGPSYPVEDDSLIEEVAPVKAKKVSKRRQKDKTTENHEASKPWITMEEVALYKAWIDVSENNIRGNAMKTMGFRFTVLDYFEKEMREYVRGYDANTSKWKNRKRMVMGKRYKKFDQLVGTELKRKHPRPLVLNLHLLREQLQPALSFKVYRITLKERRQWRWALEFKIKKEEIKRRGGRLVSTLVCEETDSITPRIRYFDFPKTRMPSHIKTYDGSEDPEDHLKIFQAAAKIERWAMPTWCHMFNSTLTGNVRVWFDDLPLKSIDNYDDLKKAFMKSYLQQKKYIKDPIELHNIKQQDGESTEDFMRRYKLESRDVKGAPKCMRISGFVHGITGPEVIKRLHDKILKKGDEMMRVTTSFFRGEVAVSNHERKKSFPPWKQHEGNQKQNFKKGGFRNQQRSKRKQDRFSLLTKTPKEIFALDKGKFKAPPPMTTPVEKQNHAKFCEFHGEVGHNMDKCMHQRKQIEEMLKAEKLSHLIKEVKQNNGKEQPKVAKKEASGKDKALAILMVQLWERVARQRITQSFSPNLEILFPPLGEDEGAEGLMIIEAKIRGHCIHHMYVDGRSASEIMYEHCFNRLRPEIKKQLITATTPLIGFSAQLGHFRLEACRYERCPKTHRLNVWEGCSLVRQKKRGQAADRNQAIQEEVEKLIEAGIMREILSRPEVAGRLQKWSIELEEYAIHYRPKVSVKGHILADLIVKRPEEDSPDTPMEEERELLEPWNLFTDGSSCTDGSGAGLILTNPERTEFTYALRFRFDATNNEAQYEALIAGLRISEKMGVKNLQANVDSRLVANQLNETYVAKEADMIRYLEKVKALTGSFKAFSIK
uniref:Reverse transcriptase domain-containing protein n=1 Tax=Tanacetum cinerariifolium TaxID=118510 RepID=A0A699HBJ2_TANCI|nr:reverse transcriptase domain-containing protein [Tanacetum cinerariifolium]